jgi:hypothetical protein
MSKRYSIPIYSCFHVICLQITYHTVKIFSVQSFKRNKWAFSSKGTSTYRDPLQYVTKHLMTNAECEQTGNKGQIDSTMLCAGDVGIDACQVMNILFFCFESVSHQSCLRYLATFQLNWWMNTSSARPCIVPDTKRHLSRTTDIQ